MKLTPKAPSKIVPLNPRLKSRIQNPIKVDSLYSKDKPVIIITRRLGGIGDVIMSTPLLASIKQLIPHCHLVYATDLNYAEGSLREVIEHCPFVDELISFAEAKDYKCDYSLDITTTGLSRELSGTIPPNRIDMFAEAAGLSVENNPVPVYIVKEEESIAIKEEFSSILNKGYKLIAIQTRSNDQRRTWPKANLKSLIELLLKHEDFRLILLDWGGEVDAWSSFSSDKKNCIPFLNRSISDTAALLELCDLVVCPDSSILHLAGALNKSIVSIFGPIPPQSRINHYKKAIAVSIKACRMQYCWYSPKCVKNSPVNSKLACLNNLTGELVYKEVINKLEDKVIKSTEVVKDCILVKRDSTGIGDILMAANGIETLKVKYPNKEIHLACPKSIHESLLGTNIDCIIDLKDIDKSKYALTFDISLPCARYETARVASKKPVEKNRVEIYAEVMGVRNLLQDLLPRYYPSKEELDNISIKYNLNKDKKTVFIAPCSMEEYRNWPEKNYLELVNLIKNDYNVILQSNNIVDGVINLNPKENSIRDTGALITISDLVVTIDSAPLHIAAALKKETIAIFGPIDYKARCKGYKNITVIKSTCPYMPCWRNAIIKCRQDNSLDGPSKCLIDIRGKQVFQVLKEKLK